MSLTLTEEQTAIIEAVKNDPASLVINALAGAAKTTTLVLAAQAMRPTTTICVAFNKRISEEMAKRMPSFVACSTMNSVGHRAWGQRLGKRLILDTDKGYSILSEITSALTGEDKRYAGECFASILRGIRHAKSSGYIPDEYASLGKRLIDQEGFIVGFAAQSDVEMDGFFFKILDKALCISIAQAFEGKIDFDDQIYMSALFGGTFPRYDVVLVDEAQDLSLINHLIIEKMVGRRLIAVGDPNQAIYGFRGADYSSMEKLKKQFSAKELSLSTSFRCPISVVKRAQYRVPHMNWAPWAEEGEVKNLSEWSAETVPDGAVILCRNNAPLFKTALRMIREGRGVKVHGADIGKSLIKVMKGLGPGATSSKDALDLLAAWTDDQIAKAHEARKHAIVDRAECIRVFIELSATLDEAIARAEHLFAQTGKVDLMTGHKAKGGEWNTVFHLDPFLIPSKFARRLADEGDDSAIEQERNLRYVIETRSKDKLYFVTSEDWK